MNRIVRIVVIATFAVAAATAAFAQVNLPRLPQPQLPAVTEPVTGALRTPASTLAGARKLRVRELLRTERATVEVDPDGQPILRRQVGALSPSPEALARARGAGFTELSSDRLEALDVTLVVLQAPEGLSTRRALRTLRELDPDGQYDYNHLYVGSGALDDESAPPLAATVPPPLSTGTRIGLIDTGIDGLHPLLADATIVRHGCEGGLHPGPHGTAVASLLVGQGAGFASMMPGATLFAADIFCGHGGGSLSRLALELDWMAREKVAVVNISLVGAKSVLLTGLVRAMTARGFLLVAAVGNDGPTAPPLFPAAYPEVIGVTGVDARRRLLPEACRGEQVDFAAAGAGFSAAAVGGGYVEVRGTSFATPIVAGLLAHTLQAPDPEDARAAVNSLAATAIDVGDDGVDLSYGKGLVGVGLQPGHRE